MKPRSRPHRLLAVLLCLSILFVCGSLIPRHSGDATESTTTIDAQVKRVAPGWTVGAIRQVPDDITALLAVADSDDHSEAIYIGTGGPGGIYQAYRGGDLFLPTIKTIAVGLGDTENFCICHVNALTICDLDHDGTSELVAETSQILPRGRPRVYVWSLTIPPLLRGFARPAIESSWGHGVAIVPHSGEPDRILSTYCGFGEVVEYELGSSISPDGFRHDSLGWRTTGRLPFSGEGIQLADADNDGDVDICLATGYAFEKAAIQICSLDDQADLGEPKLIIDEGCRFGTVRFLVGSVSSDGSQDVFAWWCEGLGAGHTEILQYRLSPQGIVTRVEIASGNSDEFWPIDGQVTLADMDADGTSEVWFATAAGRLWRYTTSQTPPLLLVGDVTAGIGPVAAGGSPHEPRLYLGSGPRLLQVRWLQ